MEMKNTFVELEQFEELTPEVLEEVNGGGNFFCSLFGLCQPRYCSPAPTKTVIGQYGFDFY